MVTTEQKCAEKLLVSEDMKSSFCASEKQFLCEDSYGFQNGTADFAIMAHNKSLVQ